MKLATQYTTFFCFISLFNFGYIFTNADLPYQHGVTFDGLVGGLPGQLGRFYTQVKSNKEIKLWTNSLLLYGPPGNGKTEIARTIVQCLPATMFELVGSNIITTYQNSGSEKITQIFEKAEASSKRGERVCIFIDEIDLLVSKDTPENYKDMNSAATTLWTKISNNIKNKNFVFIFTTNNIDKIPKQFVGRMSTQVEIKNPSAQMRAEILQAHYALLYLPELDKFEVESALSNLNQSAKEIFYPMLKETLDKIDAINLTGERIFNGIHPKDEKELFSLHLNGLEATYHSIKASIISDVTERKHNQDPDHLHSICPSYETIKESVEQAIENNETVVVGISSHFLEDPALMAFMATLKKFVTNGRSYIRTPAKLSPDMLKMFVDKTDGLCVRRTLNVLHKVAGVQVCLATKSITLEQATKVADETIQEFRKNDSKPWNTKKMRQVLNDVSQGSVIANTFVNLARLFVGSE